MSTSIWITVGPCVHGEVECVIVYPTHPIFVREGLSCGEVRRGMLTRAQPEAGTGRGAARPGSESKAVWC